MAGSGEEALEPKRGRGRRRAKRTEDPVFAGIVLAFAEVIRRFLLPPPPDEGGLAGSRVPRRPPDKSGSGSVALAEPTDEEDA
jgi:hypothetical protein